MTLFLKFTTSIELQNHTISVCDFNQTTVDDIETFEDSKFSGPSCVIINQNMEVIDVP